MDWKRFFDFSGRNSRKQFWLTLLLTLGGYVLSAVATVALGSFLGAVIGLPLVVAAIVVGLCNAVRRLHDLGKTGWWVLGIGLLTVVIEAPAAVAGEAGVIFSLLAALISLGWTLWLGLAKGQAGENRFGPPPGQPLAPTAEDQLEGEEIHYSGED